MDYRFLILFGGCFFWCVHYGGAQNVTNHSTGNPPTQSITGSLIHCARQCANIPQCVVMLYGELSPPYDCGYGYNPDDVKQTTGDLFRSTLVFVMNRSNSSVIFQKCMSYVEVSSSPITVHMPSDMTSCMVLFGTPDLNSLLKIESRLKCDGTCTDDDTVTIYNVRDNVTDAVVPLDQPEGSVVCQKATANQITSVFLAANESYALIQMNRSENSNYSLTLNVFAENWTAPYYCRDCVDLGISQSNLCRAESTATLKPFVKFHNLNADDAAVLGTSHSTPQNTTKKGGTLPTSSTKSTRPTPGPTTKGTTISIAPLDKPTISDIPTSTNPTARKHNHTDINETGENEPENNENETKENKETSGKNETRNNEKIDSHETRNNETSEHNETRNNETSEHNETRNNETSGKNETRNNGTSAKINEDGSVDAGVIGGAVAGGAVVVVLASLLMALLYRRNRNKISPRLPVKLKEQGAGIEMEEKAQDHEGSTPPRVHDLNS